MDPPFFFAIDLYLRFEYNNNATSVADRTKRGNEYAFKKC